MGARDTMALACGTKAEGLGFSLALAVDEFSFGWGRER